MSFSHTPRRHINSDWPIDPALENPDPSPRTRGSPTRPTWASQNEKEDELEEIQPEAGPSRPRRMPSIDADHENGVRTTRSRRRRSESASNAGVDFEDDRGDITTPTRSARKRRKTAAERRQSAAQGWETRRLNLWAERVLPTYSTGLETDYSDLPPDFLLDSISQHAGQYFRDRGLMKDPRRKPYMRQKIKPNKKRTVLEQGGAVARVLRESGVDVRRLSLGLGEDVVAEGTEEGGEGEGAGDGEDGAMDEDADESGRLRPRKSTESANALDEEGSSSDTDASEDAYRPEEDEDASDADGQTVAKKSKNVPPHLSLHGARSSPVAPSTPGPLTSSPRRRGPYIRRDMRNAIQGAGLLALGVLVEEMIKAQLAMAGYAKESAAGAEGDAEPAPAPAPDAEA